MENTLEQKRNKLFIVLAGIFITNALLAEMIGVKIFSVESTLGLPAANLSILGFTMDFNLTAGAVIWPLVFITTDLINEYFGKPGVKRISYFTDHVIRNLIHFRNQHYKLEKLLDECVNNTNEKNIRIFTTMAESMSDFNMSYSLPFTQDLLNNSSNFIANPWIVNKFLDYFPSFQLGLNEIKNGSSYSFNDFTRLITIRGLNFNLNRRMN